MDIKQRICDTVARCPVNMTEQDMFDCLSIKRRFPLLMQDILGKYRPSVSVEVITEYGKIAHEFFDAHGYLIFDEWKKYYDLGFTTVVSNILDLTSELRYLDKELTKIIGKPTYGNLYFSKGSNGNAVSFPHHDHEYDVVVKPIYGKYTWKINDELIENEHKIIYIPSGTYHSVVDVPGPKLSLTLNLTL